METLPTAVEKQSLVSRFLEIAVGQTVETATQFLQATSWKLEDAIELFCIGNDGVGGGSASASASSSASIPVEQNFRGDGNVVSGYGGGKESAIDEVRAPLPAKKDTLYGDASFVRMLPNTIVAFRDFNQESRRPEVWESDQSAPSTTDGTRDNLASLYRPPFSLMYNGPFDKAKMEASVLDKWLLVNLQSTEEFSSHMLNRDTWCNEAVAQIIRTNFIFWQVYHDTSEGKKVCTYYNLVSMPAILVIDPVTGQKMRSWTGMVQPERILEDLLPFLEGGPQQQHFSLPLKRRREGIKESPVVLQEKQLEDDPDLLIAVAASLEETKAPVEACVDFESKISVDTKSIVKKEPVYPPLPEEPKGNREEICRVGIRLPDGRRIQRNFLRSDPIEAIPGASKTLEYGSNTTFDESGLSNSMISMLWD